MSNSTRLYNLLPIDSTDALAQARQQIGIAVSDKWTGSVDSMVQSALTLPTDTLVGELRSMLDLDVTEVMARAWSRAFEVRKIVAQSAKSPGQPMQASLVEHEFDSVHEPKLIVSIAGADLFDIKFKVKIAANVKGLTLHVKAGALTAFSLAEPTMVELALSCESLELKKFDKTMSLQGTVSLSRPIQLQPLDPADESTDGLATVS